MDFAKKRSLLVSHLEKERLIKTTQVKKAFLKTPREKFILEKYKRFAYTDEPLPLEAGQTISAPHMVALMTELLDPKKTDKVLEIGTGSGYQAALLSRLVKHVYSTEVQKDLIPFAQQNLKSARIKNVTVIEKDGIFGHQKHALYDKIIVTCAVHTIPHALIRQLKAGGLLIAPVGKQWYQELTVGIKRKGKLEKTTHGGCVFVPLTRKK